MTGFAIVEARGSKTEVVAHGVLRSSTNDSFPQRLLRIADALAGVIEAHSPHEAAIEDLFHSVNPRSALQLAHLRGAVVVEVARRGIPIFAYSPRAVKKAITGSGGADKFQVRSMVERLARIRLGKSPTDVSDALAVAICHAHTRRALAR